MAVLLWCLILTFSGTFARKLTDEEYFLLPPLFHLDNYERCLSQSEGLYCLGTFELTPEAEPNRLYTLMKEYSEEFRTFNRTLIRRGYCVSTRCPSTERNASLRFERCAAQWGQARSLQTSLRTLHYCHGSDEQRLSAAKTLSTEYRVVLNAFYVLLFLNFLGTAYDFMTEGNAGRNRQILFWSARSNWHRLTACHKDGDPGDVQLLPLQGIRIVALTTMIYVHSAIASFRPYVNNPQFLEQTLEQVKGSFLTSSTILVQVFVILSSFLSTYNLLLYSQKNPLSFKLVPLTIIKRITRITPLYLFVIGYAATWWNVGYGPQWPVVIGSESRVCRHKFWSQILYVSNLVEPNQTCLMQTWFLAADMHLNILSTVLVVTMAKWRSRALRILSSMFLACCLFTSVVAYIFHWQPVHQIVTPDFLLIDEFSEVSVHKLRFDIKVRLRVMFANEHPSTFTLSSFTRLHLATWGYFHAVCLGQAIAHLRFKIQEQKTEGSVIKCLTFGYNLSLPMMALWTVSGHWTRDHTGRLTAAIYTGLERLLYGLLLAFIVFGAGNLKCRLNDFFSWRGWVVMGRLSLAVMLSHWCVNLILISSRTNAAPMSRISFAVDAVTTGFFTYLIAVPLTILIEMPMQKSLDYMIFNLLLKFK